MNEIKITLTVPGLPEAINNLADAIRGNSTAAPVASAPVVQQPEAKATQPVAAPVVNPTTPAAAPVQTPVANTAPVNAAPVVNAAPSVPSAPAPSNAAAVNYTIEQLSVAGAALCEQGKMPQLIALLGKYGVQAVTQLNPAPETLNAFAAELKALGANL